MYVCVEQFPKAGFLRAQDAGGAENQDFYLRFYVFGIEMSTALAFWTVSGSQMQPGAGKVPGPCEH